MQVFVWSTEDLVPDTVLITLASAVIDVPFRKWQIDSMSQQDMQMVFYAIEQIRNTGIEFIKSVAHESYAYFFSNQDPARHHDTDQPNPGKYLTSLACRYLRDAQDALGKLNDLKDAKVGLPAKEQLALADEVAVVLALATCLKKTSDEVWNVLATPPLACSPSPFFRRR